MTDTASSSKPMWTRCPGCKDRVFNDKLDIGIHRGHCPADLQRKLQDLERRFIDLREQFGRLDEELSAGPAIDPDDIAPWAADDTPDDGPVGEGFDDEEDELADEDLDTRPPLTAYASGTLTGLGTVPGALQ